MQLRFLIFVILIISSSKGFGQPAESGAWLYYFGNNKISSNWNWHNEIQHRNYSFTGDLEQLLIRTGIGYQLGRDNNLLIGYGFIHSENYEDLIDTKTRFSEHRIFQQWISSDKYGRVVIQHRYRLEERFIEDDFKFRYRYFILTQIPINRKSFTSNTTYLAVYNEIFIHHERDHYFDRNRTAIMLGFCFSESIRIELGAMTQFLANRQRTQITLGLINNLSLRESL